MADSPTIVVLGGGVGGVVAARRLRSLAPADSRIVLVERQPLQSFPPSYTWVMTGQRRPASITRDLRRLRRKGVEVVETTVSSIDLESRTVSTESADISFDYLVVALGAELAPDLLPGLAGQAFSYYSLAEAERLQPVLRDFAGGRIELLISSLPYKCPAAPYEGAMLIESLLRERGLRQRVEIALSTPEAQPLPVAGPAIGAAVSELLEQKGIRFHPGRTPTEVDADTHEVIFDDGTREPYDLLIAIPPHRPPAVVRESRIAGPNGWAQVDPASLMTADDRVFAIGDVVHIPLPDGLALPKAGVFAHGEAEVVARNITAAIRRSSRRRRFDGSGSCFLESGDGKAGRARGNFYQHPRDIRMSAPSSLGRLAKVGFERWWLQRWY